jgi:hypothetical protein
MESHRRQARRSFGSVRPTLEAMEMRELLSVVPLLAEGSVAPSPAALTAAALAALNPATSSSPLMGTDPTAHELARERFHGYFSGPVSVGGGRFGNQARTLYFQGLGGSSMFEHGDYQMAIVFPADPTQALFGEAYLQDKNTNSSGQIGLTLQGTTPQTYDKLGRPTRMTFTDDPAISSGIFVSNTASGTLQIHYSEGSATAIFNGLVYTTGLTSPLANSALYSRGGRITPRSG